MLRLAVGVEQLRADQHVVEIDRSGLRGIVDGRRRAHVEHDGVRQLPSREAAPRSKLASQLARPARRAAGLAAEQRQRDLLAARIRRVVDLMNHEAARDVDGTPRMREHRDAVVVAHHDRAAAARRARRALLPAASGFATGSMARAPARRTHRPVAGDAPATLFAQRVE